MLFTAVFVASLAVASAQLGTAAPPAPVINDNAPGVVYGATFDGTQGAGIKGTVTLSSASSGTGTIFKIDLSNLPPQASGGPFLYHVHQFRVPASGNCTAAGAHLDPENRGEKPPCDSSNPASCQVGDLAGKYGKISSSPFITSYLDLYNSLTVGSPAFAGNRSIVIHDLNTTRIACANIEMLNGNSSTSTGAPYPTGGSASGAAAPTGTATSGSSSGSGSRSGSGSGSSVTANGQNAATATSTPVKPSTSPSVVASAAAPGRNLATGAIMLAAAAFLL